MPCFQVLVVYYLVITRLLDYHLVIRLSPGYHHLIITWFSSTDLFIVLFSGSGYYYLVITSLFNYYLIIRLSPGYHHLTCPLSYFQVLFIFIWLSPVCLITLLSGYYLPSLSGYQFILFSGSILIISTCLSPGYWKDRSLSLKLLRVSLLSLLSAICQAARMRMCGLCLTVSFTSCAALS